MVHNREPHNNEVNNGASGSHGGERYHAKTSYRDETKGKILFGGATNRIPVSSRITPMPYTSCFLETQ
jgi:hypothetical protein